MAVLANVLTLCFPGTSTRINDNGVYSDTSQDANYQIKAPGSKALSRSLQTARHAAPANSGNKDEKKKKRGKGGKKCRTFIREHARVLRAPLASTMESCPARASNLFGAVTKGKPVSLAMSAAISSSYP